MAFKDTGDQRVDLLGLADVAGVGLATAGRREGHRLLERLGAPPAHDHPGSAGRHLQRGGATQSAAPAAEEHDAVRQEVVGEHG